MAASFYLVTSGNVAQAQDVNQILYALRGDSGLGIPLSPTAINDSVNFALSVKNLDATNSRALQVIRANGTILLQADVNGLVASVDGTPSVSQLVNTSTAQTLTSKTLTSPVINSPTISTGSLSIGANASTTGSAINMGSGLTIYARNNANSGDVQVLVKDSLDRVSIASNTILATSTSLAFFGGTVQTMQNVTGSRGGNAALASLLTALASYGLISNSTSA